MVHIRQKHWLDLMLVQLLCILQWFNPVIWIYIRLIRQNHEYIADKVALQRTSDPAIYRAASVEPDCWLSCHQPGEFLQLFT